MKASPGSALRRALGVLALLLAAWPRLCAAAPPDVEKISRIVGVEATTTPDGVVRIAWPRKDVPVRVDRMRLDPFLGLGSWAAMRAEPGTADILMLMADTVVFEDEVNPAIDAALASGLKVTGVHNHFFYDEPKVYFLHLGGEGTTEGIATAVRNVWDSIKRVRERRPQPALSFPGFLPRRGPLDTASISRIVGQAGEAQGDLYKITLGLTTKMQGMEVGGSLGVATWFGFLGNDELAVVDGDFAMTEAQVQPVLRALRRADINIVALHNHMIGDDPPIYFTHFWGKGPVLTLARGIRAALDAQKMAGI